MEKVVNPYENNTVKIPPTLKTMKEFPLATLKERLHDNFQLMESMKENKSSLSFWSLIFIGIAIIIGVLILKCICKRYSQNFKGVVSKCFSSNEKRECNTVKRSTSKRKYVKQSQNADELPQAYEARDHELNDMTVAALVHCDETRPHTIIKTSYPGTNGVESPPGKRTKLETKPSVPGGNGQ